MKNFVTPHCHIKSFDAASTTEAFAKRELELGSGYITVTDHGTMEGVREVYDICNDKKYKGKLKPILGLEAYFRDDLCPILLSNGYERDSKGTLKEAVKYLHLTMHFLNQQAFQATSKILSNAFLTAEKHGSEFKPIFDWRDLEELGGQDITMSSSCLIGVVGRHLLQNNDPDSARKYYDRVRSIVKPGNFFVELFPHVCDKNWESAVFVKFANGTEQKIRSAARLMTKNGKIEAKLLAAHFQADKKRALAIHICIEEIMINRKFVPFQQPAEIVDVELREGFLQNECRPWSPNGDPQLGVNKFVLELAEKYGDPVLISDDSHFAFPEEKILQDMILGQMGNWKFSNSHHRLSNSEVLSYLKANLDMGEYHLEKMVDASHEWASKFDNFKFNTPKTLPTSFYPKDTIGHTFELIKKHGRMDWKNTEMAERLKKELDLLYRNGTIDLLPYFMIDEEVCDLYLKNGQLTGPGRGSAAGLLLTYLMGITHVDPLKYDLSMDRFITLDRIAQGKYPDIDQDLPHRDLLVDSDDPNNKGWLKERFGRNVAQISTETTIRLKNAIRDTVRARHGSISDDIESICKKLPNPPQGIDDDKFVFGYELEGVHVPGAIETNKFLQEFVEKYPEDWKIASNLMGLKRDKGRHACAFCISDTPIDEVMPLMNIGGVNVTQFDAHSVEAMGYLKMDFLVVNSLRDLQDTIRLIQDRDSGTNLDWSSARKFNETPPSVVIDGKKVPYIRLVPKDGKLFDIWDLPNDVEVFRDICSGNTESVFQFNTPSAQMWFDYFFDNNQPMLRNIEDLAAFTALDRPGPLDAKVKDATGEPKHNMLVEFSQRAKDKERFEDVEVLNKLLPETYGIIVYQEQLQKIYQMVGETTGIEANNFRQHVSKKDMDKVQNEDKAIFMKGASKHGQLAEDLWEKMVTFGQYGFNKSHAVCYVHISYACSWLKRHFPLEWWTSVLRNAERDEICNRFWSHCGQYIDLPDINNPNSKFDIVDNRIKAPVSLLHGIGEKAHAQIVANAPYKDINDFCLKVKDFKRSNPNKKTKMIQDPETGLYREETKITEGRSALTSRVVVTLIIGGAMDNLFPPDTTIESKIDMYYEASKAAGEKINNKKKAELVEKYAKLNSLEKFQLRKMILPSYSADLRSVAVESIPDRFSITNGKPSFKEIIDIKTAHKTFKKTLEYIFYNGLELDAFEAAAETDLIPSDGIMASFLGYVSSAHVWQYPKNSTNPKTACKMMVDVEGRVREVVKWPNADGSLAPEFKNVEGAIVYLTFFKEPGKETRVSSIKILKGPLEEDV